MDYARAGKPIDRWLFSIILTTMLALFSLSAQGNEMNTLSDYRWKNRLILVQSASGTEGALQILRDAKAEVDDRDIVWFVNTGTKVISNQGTVSSGVQKQVKARFEKARNDEHVLLIGKDGGVKSREAALNLDAIFERIDAMPMRIREMRTDSL